MFAGSCIGVILLVMSLECLRRMGKEYDRYLQRQYRRKEKTESGQDLTPYGPPAQFTPTIFEQAVRALLHVLQFAVAYFVML